MESFSTLGLPNNVVRAVEALGFNEPTSIQQRAIPTMLTSDSDIIALAQTGTGKTAAFGLPLVSRIDANIKSVQGIILCPTRELCLQITRDLENFAKFSDHVRVTPVYGGANISTQISQLKKGTQIIVATPGRMVDLINRGAVKIQDVRFAILDEADEMLNMGFKDELDRILEETPASKTTWLFSATMPKEVARIAQRYMDNPTEIKGAGAQTSNTNINHTYTTVRQQDKYRVLRRIIDANPDLYAIVFCRTRRDTNDIAEKLIKDGYKADAIHGDLSQAQRELVMKRFRNKNINMLIATDVAARGIDVDDITHVIHYHLPDEPESYTHRSGRTARAGKSGESIALLAGRDSSKLRAFEKAAGTKWNEYVIPEPVDIVQAKMMQTLHSLKETEIHPEVANMINTMSGDLANWDVRELLGKIMTNEMAKLIGYYKNEQTLSTEDGPRSKTPKGVKKLFVNLGKFDRISERDLKQFLAEMANFNVNDFTYLSMRKSYSFVEVKESMAKKLVKSSEGSFFGDRPVVVEIRDEDFGHRTAKKSRVQKPANKKKFGKRKRVKF